MMKKIVPKISAMLLILSVLGLASLTLTGCNTTAGMGKDIEAAGDAIKDKAEEEKKY
jgi:predicted small secreted protein